MNNEEIKEAIEYFKKNGVTIRVRDIAYTLLAQHFESDLTAYQCLFGSDGYEEYHSSKERAEIAEYLRLQGYIGNDDETTNGITFEENKREMENLLQKIEAGMKDGTIDPAVGLKTQADIRVKLNDKFKVEKQNLERAITVQPKFDFICPKHHIECYQLSKDYAMEKFNLIEKE